MKSVTGSLLAFTFLAGLAQATAAPQAIEQGGMSGGGGDPLRIYFEEGRDLAVHILGELDPRALSSTDQKLQATNWIKAHRQELIQELSSSKLVWKEGHETCAWTNFTPQAEITLSFTHCREHISSKEEAAKILIHEAAHHLKVEDHAMADRIAIESFAAWERTKLLAVPACPTDQSMVASVVPGTWKTNVELRKQLNSGNASLDQAVLRFEKDDRVANEFPPFGACALAAGYFTFENQGEKIVRAKAVLVSQQGNVYLVWLERMNEDGTPDFESTILNVARAKESANDILFLGDDLNQPGVFPMQRVRD